MKDLEINMTQQDAERLDVATFAELMMASPDGTVEHVDAHTEARIVSAAGYVALPEDGHNWIGVNDRDFS